jgi:hypothetical protein
METGLRWWLAACFTGIGVFLLVGRHYLRSDAALIRTSGLDEVAADRLKSAIARRVEMEELPRAGRISLAGFCILAGAVFAAFTRVDLAVLYASVCVVITMVFWDRYLRLRNAGTRRAAVLRARTRNAVIPPWIFAAVALSVITPLAFFNVAPFAAILVSAAGVAMAVAGDRSARLPALMSGDDPPVEQYLDDRLRRLRAANIVTTAAAPAYLFDFMGLLMWHDLSTLHFAALGVAMVAQLILTAWYNLMIWRLPGARDAERWSRFPVGEG